MIAREASADRAWRIMRETPEGELWAERWNDYVRAHLDDPAYKDRVTADPKYMRLYRRAMGAGTAPARLRAIKALLAYADGLGAAEGTP